jgi:hypothetical protein
VLDEVKHEVVAMKEINWQKWRQWRMERLITQNFWIFYIMYEEKYRTVSQKK